MTANRSPNYPAISLPEAVDLVSKLYQRERRSPVDAERAALALGYNSLSGASRTKLSGLRKFDLVEDTGNGIRVSVLAMAILHPESPDEKQDALRKAAIAPALFRDLSELPGASDNNLVSRLVRQGFTEAGAKLAVASFRKTMSLAPGEGGEYDEPYDQMQEDVAPLVAETLQRRSAPVLSTNRGTVLRIELPGGAPAELRLPESATPDDLKAVVDWLSHKPKVSEAPKDAEARPAPEPGPTAPEQPAERSPDAAPD
jgi:hypothetical protein